MIGCDTLFDPSFYCRRRHRAGTECRAPSVCNLLQDPGGNQSSNAAVAARSQSQSPRLCNVVYSKRYVWLFGSAIQAKTAAMTDTYLLTQQRVKQQVFKQVAFINHSNWRKVEPELWHAARRTRRWCFVRSPVDVLWPSPPPPVSNRALQLDLVVSTSTMHWWFLTC